MRRSNTCGCGVEVEATREETTSLREEERLALGSGEADGESCGREFGGRGKMREAARNRHFRRRALMDSSAVSSVSESGGVKLDGRKA
jgi:hypothetical protein